jgi:hypothetical protein
MIESIRESVKSNQDYLHADEDGFSQVYYIAARDIHTSSGIVPEQEMF